MYASGETLLRNFPVQATIQVVDWSSDEEEDDDNWNTTQKNVLYLAGKKARKVPRRARLKKEIFKKFKEL